MLGREEDILDLFLTDTEVQIGTVTTKSSISYKKIAVVYSKGWVHSSQIDRRLHIRKIIGKEIYSQILQF